MGVLAGNPVRVSGTKPRYNPTIWESYSKSSADYYARTGGLYVQEGTGKGSITILNCQKKLPAAEIVAATELVRKDARFRFDIKEAALKPSADGSCPYTAQKAALGAKIMIAVIDDAKKPTLVTAPEEGWAVVNVANLDKGLTEGAKAKFVAQRARQEILRAFCMAAGAASSQFPGNILSVNTLKDLDYCGEFIPMDAVQRVIEQLHKIGIEPEHAATYRRACIEGWAPAPTNEVQKTLFERYGQED